MNDRFKIIKDWNIPEWRENTFNKKFPKKPAKIFVNSMSDIVWWKNEWMERVIDKIKLYPGHTFMFLSKFPEAYKKWGFPQNCWLGATALEQKTFDRNFGILRNGFENNPTFISLEPMFGKVSFYGDYHRDDIQLLIIGAETGNRKGKIIPSKWWIKRLKEECENYEIPVFLKDSVKEYELWEK